MPDYGDDRGFIMNVPQRVVRPNIGVDRVGPGTNYNGGYGGKVQNPAISFSSQPGGPSNEYFRRPMGRGRFEGRQFGPPPNIGFDRMGSGIMQNEAAMGMVNNILPGERDIAQTGNPATDWKTLEAKIREIEINNPGIDPEEIQRLMMEWLADQQQRVI